MHLLFGVGNTNSTSFNITETKFLKVSRQSSVLSGYNMLSGIPSKQNSILDKLINEEGDRGAAPTSMASAAAAAASRNKVHVLSPRVRNAHTERRALKQIFEPKCKRMYEFKRDNPCEIPYCDMETGRGEVAHSRRWTVALTTHAQHKGTAKRRLLA